MRYINRKIAKVIQGVLKRQKSVLLFGARQTGKTTMINTEIKPDLSFTLMDPVVRLRYEKDPSLFSRELAYALSTYERPPVVFIDEIQRIPHIADMAQVFIDEKKAQFILTGSSAHKLKHGTAVNLLPGRVVALTMDPFHLDELPADKKELNRLLVDGSLPFIISDDHPADRELDMRSYVTTYLEEEIRAEALVRNVGNFARFLELAASESGQVINFTKLSQDIGVASSTIIDYYQILEDSMIVSRVDPITHSRTHRRLIKAPKYLFFDLGVRRACANEGALMSEKNLGHCFEQFIGLELLHLLRERMRGFLRYWRDANGVEVDYVIEMEGSYCPVEVKWTDNPTLKDARHLSKFLSETPNAKHGYIVCRIAAPAMITEKITALPWQKISQCVEGL